MSHQGTEPTSVPEAWRERGLEVEKGAAKTLSMMLRNEGAGVIRVHCQHCQTMFDVFDVLIPDAINPQTGETKQEDRLSTTEQRIIEHLGACGRAAGVLVGHEQLCSIVLHQNLNTAQHLKATTVWR